jgi:glycosyltransferase involved in cell wall biosynthesis
MSSPQTPPANATGAIRDPARSKEISEETAVQFLKDHPAPGADVVVLIPAFNEEEAVADVVKTVPKTICGLDVETIVVDDGSRDATTEQAEGAGALVCRLPINLGQGAAFRLGYRVARDRGTKIICTADADGQFDPQELPALVGPILAGEADFVNGSRRLGMTHNTDPVRNLGVVVFATLLSTLTGVKITDPANGLRAFKSEVTAKVQLKQTQYQTSEMLINTIAYGFKVKEVPATMYQRAAGESKKGKNWIYGARFARVVIDTWWRMRPVAKQNLPARQGLWF